MITKEMKRNGITLYDMIQLAGGGFDIADEDWDWGVYMDCRDSWEECEDYYDKLMLLMAEHIICLNYNSDWYSPCQVAKFITKHIEAFTKFFNEENREGYRPLDYAGSADAEKDDGFYEAYMMPLESLIAGNYSEDNYEKLYKLLTEGAKED